MSYVIKHTSGTQLVTIQDGTQNSTTTSLSLFGKGTPYGELLNQNLVTLLENSADVVPPTPALDGQLWYDIEPSRSRRLKLADSGNWSAIATEDWVVSQPFAAGFTSSVAGLVSGSASDTLIIAQGGTALRALKDRFAEVINPLDWTGFDTTGTHDNTTILQACAAAIPSKGALIELPTGTMIVSGTVMLPARTAIRGKGRASKLYWQSPVAQAQFFKNINYNAAAITDTDFLFCDMDLIYFDTGVGASADANAIDLRMVSRAIVRNCNFYDGQTHVNFGASDETIISGCVSYSPAKNAFNHYEHPTNAKIVNNSIHFLQGANQPINFTASNTDATSAAISGTIADGLLVEGNVIYSTGQTCTIQPSDANSSVSNVVIANNKFYNTSLTMCGNVRGATISGNTFSANLSNSPISIFAAYGSSPDGMTISGNTFIDPTPVHGDPGVIRVEATNSIVTSNSFAGITYGLTPGINTGPFPVLVAANYLSNGRPVQSTSVAQCGPLTFGNGTFLSFLDTGGVENTLCLRPDDTLVLTGTQLDGNARTILSMPQRSSTSSMTWAVPQIFGDRISLKTTASMTATGNVQGNAAPLSSNVNEIVACVSGTSDGVMLAALSGAPQWVINASSASLKVYPAVSGTINGGAANAPFVLTAGQKANFIYIGSNKFYSL